MKIDKIIGLLLFLTLVMMSVSCKGESTITKAQGTEDNHISVILNTEYPHDLEGMVYPGEKVFLNYSRADNKSAIDETKTIVWTFTGISSGNISNDSVSKEGWDADLVKEFNEEGTYRIRADLYDLKQYESVGVEAPLLATDEREITVEAIDLEIETVVIQEKIKQYIPRILNPEIGPVFTALRMNFGDNTSEIYEGKISDNITHTYLEKGIYNVTAELLLKRKYDVLIIADSETTVRVRGELDIVPPSGPLKTDTEYTFQAQQVETLTSKPKYKWAFGDGKVSRILSTDEVTHSYVQPGSYAVHVDLIDGETRENTILASTDLTVEIEESGYFLTELQQMKKFDLVFTVQHDYTNHTTGLFKWDCGSGGTLTWDGINFSLDWSKDNHSEHITGRLSEDGTIIDHLLIRHEYLDFNRITQWYQLIIDDLPISTDEAPNRFTVDRQGEELSNFVTSFDTYGTEGYYWTEGAGLHIKFTKR